jgi:membrane dipeptidase
MGGDAGTGDSLASAALPGDPGAGGSEAPAIDYSILSPEELLDEAYALQERIVTIDSHADIPFDYATPSVDPCGRIALQVDLPKMEEGGLDAVFLNVWVPQGERTPAGYERAREQATTKFRAIRRLARELCPERVELALTPDDVALIARAGKLVAVIGIENGFAIGQDLSLLETYRDLGATYMSLTHSAHNDLADSSQPRAAFGDGPSEHGGVSELGRRAIAEMNRLGMMVDVSHASRQATLDAIRLSRAPVVASHSSARTLTDHPRNLDDETLLALRDLGGVIQVVALGDYVRPPGGGTPTVSDLVDHIDHVVALIGIDHVGISSDFDGGGGIEGWSDASETVNVTAELMRRGYDEAEIAKIWGGNLLRVWRAALEVAARTP